ncbi:hypothetical protein MRX96_009299 [Rhipicephalus microplus]
MRHRRQTRPRVHPRSRLAAMDEARIRRKSESPPPLSSTHIDRLCSRRRQNISGDDGARLSTCRNPEPDLGVVRFRGKSATAAGDGCCCSSRARKATSPATFCCARPFLSSPDLYFSAMR